jgi:hypothetical protein
MEVNVRAFAYIRSMVADDVGGGGEGNGGEEQ